jgi:ABC-type transport system involved in multi-copper enzyme maturation permease subunit
MITTIASHQLLSLRRQRFFATAIAVLVGVTVLAGILGWASHQTIIGVYDESVKLLATRGQSAPPNPFLLKPVLSMLSNMVIYITMIGALVALVLGHLTVADDETNGIGRLVFTRPLDRSRYTVGKLAAAGSVLAIGFAASFLVSVAALAIVNKTFPGGADLLRLVGFYALSWLYLMVFVVIGAVTMLIARRRSLGLLAAIGVWLVVTFALPQFTSGLRPAQSLNPIVDPVSTSQTFFKITSNARPYSIAEQFKEAAGRVLQTAAVEPAGHTWLRVAPIAAAFVLLALLMARLIARHDYSRSNPE